MTSFGTTNKSETLNARFRFVDTVAHRLRKMILSGEFPPGSHLIQEDLAKQLKISRTPLRESLRVLEEEGLVVVSPTQGVRVVQVSYKMARDYYYVREMLDGLAARLAAQYIDDERLCILKQNLEYMKDSITPWDSKKWLNSNLSFHQTIAQSSNNPVLMRNIDGIIQISARLFFPTIEIKRQRAEDALGQHQQIMDAIIDRDGDRAEALARYHIQTARELLARSPGRHLTAGD